jgi:hypothetical protein
MEQYEREIAELKAQQPYQELQGVLRQKEAVEAELADVKRCLAAIVAMIQPVLGGPAAGAGMSAFDTVFPCLFQGAKEREKHSAGWLAVSRPEPSSSSTAAHSTIDGQLCVDADERHLSRVRVRRASRPLAEQQSLASGAAG